MDATGSVTLHKKGDQPKLGDAFGAWEGRPEFTHRALPGGEMMSFNLDSLQLGDYNAMRYHPQINASLSVLTFMIHQADWRIECDNPRIKDMVEDNLRQVWSRLVRAMGQAFWAGYSPAILEYENDPQGKYVVINKIKDLSPFESDVKWKKVKKGGRDTLVFDGITQYGYGHIPAMNSFWYPTLMENGSYKGRKLLKAAFSPWYFSQLMHLYTNRYFERFGEPLPIGRAPFEEEIIEPDGTRWTGKQIMEEVVQGIRNRGSVVLPSASGMGPGDRYDYSIQYLESEMRGIDFERYLTRLDEEMSIALFTPLLLLRNADVGSHNLGVQHTLTWLWMLNALLGDMKEYIDRYICQRLKSINFSEKAERCEWVPRKLGKESAETIRSMVAELIRGDKVIPDIEQLGVQLGMTLKEVKETAEPSGSLADSLPKNDTRDRTERTDKTRSGPRGVDADPAPAAKILTARVRRQVGMSWQSGHVDIDPLSDTEASFLGRDAAASVTAAIDTLNKLPTDEFDSVDAVMNVFNWSLANAERAS